MQLKHQFYDFPLNIYIFITSSPFATARTELMNGSFEVYKSPTWSGYYLKDSNLEVHGSCVLGMGEREWVYLTVC